MAAQSWPPTVFQGMPEDWLVSWRQVVMLARAAATRQMTLETQQCGVDAHVSRLRTLGGADPARFWRAVGKAIAARDSGRTRSLRMANRLIVDGLAEVAAPAPPGGRSSRRVCKQAKMPARWDVLLRTLDNARGDERVHVFRAVRHLLAQYDGWK